MKNVLNIVEKVGPKHQEQIVSSILSKAQPTTSDKSSANSNIIKISTGGRPSRILLNPKSTNNDIIFSTNDFKSMQANFNLSQKTTLGIATIIRKATANKKIIEPNLKRKLSDELHSLDEFFYIKHFNFEVGKKENLSITNIGTVSCKDINGLIEHIKERRGVSEVNLKVGIDGGGGFLKLCLSLQSPYQTNSDVLNLNEPSYETCKIAKKFHDSGVKKLLILAIAPSCQETYNNINSLHKAIELHNIDATLAIDLKVANLIVGIMSHSCMYPCTWCFAHKDHLDVGSTLRTIENIEEYYNNWKAAGEIVKIAKNFKNCINIPILKNSKNTQSLILDLIPPPELHLLLGVVNTIFNDMMKKFENVALTWAKNCHVQREVHRGSSGFNGNSCRKLLNNVDNLRSICPLDCLKFVKMLENFNAVVKACFTSELKSNYKECIFTFKSSYIDLGIPITPKVHAVFFHIIDFCSKTNVGLGYYSEQAMEAVHHDFKSIWEKKYKININHPDYMKNLLKAVCDFNGLHV